jgi:hypothetical protein
LIATIAKKTNQQRLLAAAQSATSHSVYQAWFQREAFEYPAAEFD